VEDCSLRLRLDLEEDATAKLIQRAAEEKRSVGWQAEVMLREALGLPFPSLKTAEANREKEVSGGIR
jgi:hypothetical protein